MIKKKSTKLQTFYLTVLFLLPVLAQYSIGPLDFDVIGMLMVAVGLFFSKQNYNLNKRGIIYLLIAYIAVVTLSNMIIGTLYSSRTDILLRCGRYCLYLIIVMLLCLDTLFDYRRAMKIYRMIAMAAFIYICVQAVFYYGAGITLPNKIGGVEMTNEAGEEIGRLRAFYSEPADMAYSTIPFLCCSLFGPQYSEKDRRLLDAILVSIGIILTTSGQGIVAVAVLWGLWLIHGVAHQQMSFKRVIVLITIVTAVVVLYKSGVLSFALDRATNTDEYSATSARTSGYVTMQLLSPIQWFFGTGFGNYVTANIYDLDVPFLFVNYSSVAEFLFTTGIVGVLIIACFLLNEYRKGDIRSRMLIIALLILSVGGCPMTGKYMPIYLSLICCASVPWREDEQANVPKWLRYRRKELNTHAQLR